LRLPVGPVPAGARAGELPVGARCGGDRRAAGAAGDRVEDHGGGSRAAGRPDAAGCSHPVTELPQRRVAAGVRGDCVVVTVAPARVGSFPEAFSRAETVEGWLSREQAQRLWEVALRVPAGGLLV